MKTVKDNTGFAIVDPEGNIFVASIHKNERICKIYFEEKNNVAWSQYKKEGFTCEPVTITKTKPRFEG